MLKLKINHIDGYVYILKKEEQEYQLNLSFYGLKEQPSINDFIYIEDELLVEKNILRIGQLENKYGKSVSDITESELMVLEKNHKKIYLKRLYG